MPRRAEVDGVESLDIDGGSFQAGPWGRPGGTVYYKDAIEMEEHHCPGGLRDAWAIDFDRRADARAEVWKSSMFSASFESMSSRAKEASDAADRRRQEAADLQAAREIPEELQAIAEQMGYLPYLG